MSDPRHTVQRMSALTQRWTALRTDHAAQAHLANQEAEYRILAAEDRRADEVQGFYEMAAECRATLRGLLTGHESAALEEALPQHQDANYPEFPNSCPRVSIGQGQSSHTTPSEMRRG